VGHIDGHQTWGPETPQGQILGKESPHCVCAKMKISLKTISEKLFLKHFSKIALKLEVIFIYENLM
jgi:hypothetical protein